MQVRFKAELFALLVLQLALSGCSAAKESTQPQAKQEQESIAAKDLRTEQNQKSEKVDLKQLIAEADLYYKKANYLAAEPLYKEALLRPMAYNSILDITDLVETANKLAKIYEMREQYDAAEFCHRFALEALKKSPKASKRDKAIAMYKLGCSRQQHGDYNGVELLFRESYQILKQEVVKNPYDAEALNVMAYLTFLSTDSSGAHDMWQRAIKAALTKKGKEKLQAAEALSWLARMRPEANLNPLKGGQTESLFKQSLDVVESVVGKEHPEVATKLDELGRFYNEELRDSESAVDCYARSLQIRQKTLYEFAPEIATSLNGLERCKYQQRKGNEALELAKQAHAINTRFLNPGSMFSNGTDFGLAYSLEQSGKKREAQFLRDRARLVSSPCWGCGPKYKIE